VYSQGGSVGDAENVKVDVLFPSTSMFVLTFFVMLPSLLALIAIVMVRL
jgi:hypothetical protein